MRWGILLGVLLLAGCSSSGGGKEQIQFGTPPMEIAKQLGICTNPQSVSPGTARCSFPGGDVIAVNSIAGPADQQLEVPAAKGNDFCELVGHGFGVTGLSYGNLNAHVRLNAIVARYGGQFAGSGC